MILNYKQFIHEELVHFGNTQSDASMFNLFKNDFLQIKQFLHQTLKDKNLILLGSGGFGFSFWWKNPKPLNPEFMAVNFTGEDNQNLERVIKITASEAEASMAKLYIQRFKGEPIPGLARFYWIKEIRLPKDKQWSSVFPPERDVYLRYPSILNPQLKSRIQNPKGFQINQNLRNWMSKDKMITNKIWAICLEKLEMLTDKEKTIFRLVESFEGHNISNAMTMAGIEELLNSIDELWQWLVDTNESKDFKDIFFVDLKRKRELRKIIQENNITAEELKLWFDKYIELFNNSQEYDFSIDDLHPKNLGFRNGELVIFDCM